ERISGNQYSRACHPVIARKAVCTGPVNCSQSVYAYAMTYAGIASGSTNAHSRTRCAGKRYAVTSQAESTPIESTPAATHATSNAVFRTYAPSTVRARCAQVSLAGPNTVATTARIGSRISAAAASEIVPRIPTL